MGDRCDLQETGVSFCLDGMRLFKAHSGSFPGSCDVMNSREKILVIKHGALGDFIIALGMFKSIRESYPSAHITLLTMSPFVEMARQSGFFDEIMVDNRESSWKLWVWGGICHAIAKKGFDQIYDLQVSSRTRRRYYSLIRFLSAKSFQWKFYRPGGAGCVLDIVKTRSFTWGRVTEKEAVLEEYQESDLSFLKGEGRYFDSLPEKYVLLIPGCSPDHPYKRWSVGHYQELVVKLASHGIASVILGTRTEEAEVNAIAGSSEMAVNFLNKSSLSDIPQIVLRSLAVVGNDTGPTHMAVCCDRFTVGVFCKKTENSAPRGKCFRQLVAQDINDITLEQVWALLEPELSAHFKNA